VTRVTGRWRRAAVLCVALSAGAGFAAPAQDWRATALASFDDAWKTINESFYDPTFGGVDWEGVRKELRPRVVSAASMDDARDVIREMLTRLRKSHFQLLAPSRTNTVSGPALVAAEIHVLNGDIVITRVTGAEARKAGLVPGLRLLAVDGNSTSEALRNAAGADVRSRALDGWREVMRELYGPDGSAAVLSVKDAAGKESQLTVPRSRPPGEVIAFGNLPPFASEFEERTVSTPGGKRVGYIAFNIWMPALGERIDAAVDRFRQYDGIVIDLRGNPGGLAGMISGVSGHFIDEPVQLGTMRSRQAPAPLSFKVNPRIVTSDGRRVDVFKGRVAILVDELTGSTSEVFAGAMQSLGRARVFGRQTMGQALPALTRQLPSGDVLMYAIGDFTTSTGRSLEGAGVVPDEPVTLTVEALTRGGDPDLEKAVEWLVPRLSLPRSGLVAMLPAPASRFPSAPGSADWIQD
jgi:carboxyl-terminal processing protease